MSSSPIAVRPALLTMIFIVLSAALILLPAAWAEDEGDATAGEERAKGKIVRELPELRTETSKTFSTTAGTNLTQVHSGPVNYRAGGRWHAIDNNLVDDPASGYALTNRAAGYDLALPDAAGGPVAITDGRDRVTFSLDGARGGPRAKGNGATYADALPGIDVTYEAFGDAVKESLVLSSATAGSKFSFDVQTSDGLRARENSSGGIDFVRDGEVRMSFAPPFMEDSSPERARSDKVAFDLRESGSGYTLALRADAKWLRAKDRVYPVTIDPTTNIDTNDDCYMVSGTNANTGYCGVTDPLMYVGTDTSSNVRRSFMRVDTSAVPKTAEILEGELQLYVQSGTQRNVDLHRVTRESTNARTWNKYDGTNSWTTAGGDISSSPDGSNSTFGGSAGVHRINARKLVQGWVDGSIANYGMVVKDNGSTSGLLNITGDAASNDPMMEIVWANRTGEQERWTFAEQKLSDRMSLKTNVANGNLILKENDISIPGIAGHDLSYSRSFNNLEFDTNSHDDLGQFWRGSAGYDVWLSPNGLGSTQAFNGPGDFWAPYDRKADGKYETPTGMKADLEKNTDNTFKLTYRESNRKLNFSTTGELQSEEDRNGNKISYTYGGTNGRMSAIKDSHDQGTTNNTLTFTYTSAGYVDTITDRSSPARVWDYNYTGAKLTSYVNPEGDTTSYSYDANDNLYEITDPRGTKTRFTYDTQNRVTEIWRDQVNAGPKTKYEYPTTVSSQCQDNGDANDPMDDVVGETIEKDPLWTTGTAHTTKYCWDRLLRVRKTFDGRGESRSQKYTSNSDVTTIDSMGTQAWNLTYDDQRPKEASAPAANGQSTGLKMTYGYPNDSADPNARSNPLHWLPSSLTDTESKTTDYTYDSKGNLTEVKLPLPGTPKIAIGVNSNGTTSSTTDANTTGVTSYTYEADGDLDTIDRPSTLLTETLDYDNVHRRTSHANASMPSVTETYGYDKLDRMTSTAFNAANSVTYGYDDNGNMTSRIDATGTSTYVYDKLNRLTQENLPGSRTNNYTYDAASNLATLQDAGGTTTYTYGASNLLATMQAPGDPSATTFTYNKDAQRTKTTYPNGVALTMDYEDKTDTSGNPDSSDTGPNRLKSVEAKKTSTNTVLTKFSYGYTPDTTLCGGTNADTSLRHQVTNKDNVTSKYCYDPMSRLTKASNHNGSTYDYTLDANGNITKVVKGASATSMGYDTANRLCWRIGSSQASAACTPAPSGATTYVHDTSGNLDTSSAGLNLDYNSKGQTTSMTNMSGAGTTTMSYAGSSQFERFTAGGTTFTNNALGVGAETTGTSTTYYRRDNEGGLVSQRLPSTGNPIYYYAFDGLGSVSALTDSTGAAPALYSYEPYGETTASGSAPSTPNPWRYTSAYLDSTGFYKMGMRYYRPELMRWTQQDPLEQPTDPANSNRYGYVGGDPINSADPTGLVKRRGCTANASAAQCRRQRARRSSRAPRGVNQTVKDIATIACIPAGTHPIGAALCGYYAVLEVASN